MNNSKKVRSLGRHIRPVDEREDGESTPESSDRFLYVSKVEQIGEGNVWRILEEHPEKGRRELLVSPRLKTILEEKLTPEGFDEDNGEFMTIGGEPFRELPIQYLDRYAEASACRTYYDDKDLQPMSRRGYRIFENDPIRGKRNSVWDEKGIQRG